MDVGSATLSSRCMRMPICRSRRIASWAAATDLARLTLIGKTTPGKSTSVRTGRMISASEGSDCTAAETERWSSGASWMGL
jgi:hypothetical protein